VPPLRLSSSPLEACTALLPHAGCQMTAADRCPVYAAELEALAAEPAPCSPRGFFAALPQAWEEAREAVISSGVRFSLQMAVTDLRFYADAIRMGRPLSGTSRPLRYLPTVADLSRSWRWKRQDVLDLLADHCSWVDHAHPQHNPRRPRKGGRQTAAGLSADCGETAAGLWGDCSGDMERPLCAVSGLSADCGETAAGLSEDCRRTAPVRVIGARVTTHRNTPPQEHRSPPLLPDDADQAQEADRTAADFSAASSTGCEDLSPSSGWSPAAVFNAWDEAHRLQGMSRGPRGRTAQKHATAIRDHLAAHQPPVSPEHLTEALCSLLGAWEVNLAFPPRTQTSSGVTPGPLYLAHVLARDPGSGGVQLSVHLEKTQPEAWYYGAEEPPLGAGQEDTLPEALAPIWRPPNEPRVRLEPSGTQNTHLSDYDRWAAAAAAERAQIAEAK
jgi:hypothetical protein